MLFTGTYKHSIDSKNRLAIPAEIRALLAKKLGVTEGSGESIFLYVTIEEDMTLCLYDEARFEESAVDLRKSKRSVEEILAYERLKYGTSKRVELDKAGRIRIPDELREITGVGNDVTLVGAGDHLQILDRKQWLEELKAAVKDPSNFMNPRRFSQQSEDDA